MNVALRDLERPSESFTAKLIVACIDEIGLSDADEFDTVRRYGST